MLLYCLKDCDILYINDSKNLVKKKRNELYEIITKKGSKSWAVGIVEQDVIDEINILQATYEAIRQAINKLTIQPIIYIIKRCRYNTRCKKIKQVPIIKGDAKKVSVLGQQVLHSKSDKRPYYAGL